MQISENFIKILSNDVFLKEINAHYRTDVSSWLLKNHKRFDPEVLALLGNYMPLLRKAEDKLPLWFEKRLALTGKSFEQSTSQALALFKAGLFKPKTVLSLCGGLGVDDWGFAQYADEVVSLDSDTELNTLVRYNQAKMGLERIHRIDAEVTGWLRSSDRSFDLVYIDPDRRTDDQRNIAWQDYTPDLKEVLPLGLKAGKNVVVKVSPMLSIPELEQAFDSLTAIYTLAVAHELKEVLLVSGKEPGEPRYYACDHTSGNGWETFSGERTFLLPNDFSGKKYLWVPSPALTKNNLHFSYGDAHHCSMADPSCIYLFTDEIKHSALHKSYNILKLEVFSKAVFTKYLKEKKIKKANLSTRHFMTDAVSLKKQFSIEDGGADYFFLFMAGNTPYFVHSTKTL